MLVLSSVVGHDVSSWDVDVGGCHIRFTRSGDLNHGCSLCSGDHGMCHIMCCPSPGSRFVKAIRLDHGFQCLMVSVQGTMGEIVDDMLKPLHV